MRTVDDDRFKAGRRGVLVRETDERRQTVFRQGNAMDENAERTVRGVAVVSLLVAEKVRQQRCGFGARLFGQRSQRRAEEAGDVETRARRECNRRHQLRKKRNDGQMSP